MLAARLSAMGTTCARGFMRSSLISTPKSPFMPIVRGYREGGKGFTRRSRVQMQSAQVTESAVKGKIGRKWTVKWLPRLVIEILIGVTYDRDQP